MSENKTTESGAKPNSAPDKSAAALIAAFDAARADLQGKDAGAKEVNAVLADLVARFHTPVPWANQTPQISSVLQADGGSGVVCYAFDRSIGEYVAVMVQANTDKAKNGDLYQIPGGFINFAGQEDLLTAVAREVSEEVRDINGALLAPIAKDRFVHLDHLLFYIGGKPRYVDGFGVELTQDELDTCKDFIRSLGAGQQSDGTNPKRDAFVKATENELYGMKIIPVKEILSNPACLNHQDQISLFKKLDDYLAASAKPAAAPKIAKPRKPS